MFILSLDQKANSDENAVDLILTFKTNLFLRKPPFLPVSRMNKNTQHIYVWRVPEPKSLCSAY